VNENNFRKRKEHFTVKSFQPCAQPLSWRTNQYPLSATSYSIYSNYPEVFENKVRSKIF